MTNNPQHAAAELEKALAHLRASLIYWRAEASGRTELSGITEELTDITERLAILIDEDGPVKGQP